MQPLNASQLSVARHFGGPAIVWGPPGTGKTWTLLAYLLEQVKAGRLWPYDILMLTFSRRAAAEFRLRPGESVAEVRDHRIRRGGGMLFLTGRCVCCATGYGQR